MKGYTHTKETIVRTNRRKRVNIVFNFIHANIEKFVTKKTAVHILI